MLPMLAGKWQGRVLIVVWLSAWLNESFDYANFRLGAVLISDSASVLWCCWLGSRKGILPVKNWVVGCWHGYVSGSRCRFAYGPAVVIATLAQ